MWRWDQAEPFGNNPADEDPDSNSVAFDLPLRLPGQRYDQETGLHYNYFRDYDPSLGRYGESDPIGLKGGLNTYVYVLGGPLMRSDMFGLDADGSGFSTRYGNWCGRIYSGGHEGRLIPMNPAAPVDSVDECCRTHDYCYARYECPKGCMTSDERKKGKKKCDEGIVVCLSELKGKAPRN
ncbi:MAG: RHS repeat-associated core domain-containing protein, partial [Nitrospiraceae bacterium]